MTLQRSVLFALLASTLAACGGGGNGVDTATALSSQAPAASPAPVVAATAAAAPAPAPAPASSPAPTPAGDANTVTAWVVIAMDGDNFVPAGTQSVRYGDGVNWITQTVSGTASCSVGFFGQDPSPWVQKFCEVQVTAPAVTQVPGARPVINTALMPGAAQGYGSDRVRALTSAELAASTFQPAAADIGAFRDPCTYSHMAFDDPIAFPGQPGASHLHSFAGNSLAGAASTSDSLAASGNSTCAGGTLNRTAYWQPSVIDTRTGQPLVPSGVNIYYKQGYLGVAAAAILPFPKGLRIIAGDAKNTGPAGNVLARFACLAGGSWQATIPSCAVGDSVQAAVTFPQCWDGVNLDSPDHKSHMAFATGTGCPADHPVPLPEITMNFFYKVSEANNGDYWRLSSDNYAGAGGLSLHADWYGAWDAGTLQTFVTRCIGASMDCHDNLLGDGRILY